MRLGMNCEYMSGSAQEWAHERAAIGCRAASFPLDYTAPLNVIDEYVKAAKDNDIMIAEAGTWCNPLSRDEKEREAALTRCIEQLKLADYIGASCCVNCGGSAGDFWCGYSAENFTEDFYKRVVESIHTIIDKADPKRTPYTLEPMPWIVPTGPDEYLKLIKDGDSPYFAVHLDMCNWLNHVERLAHQREFMDEVFEKLGDKIVCCHFKDLRLVEGVTVNFEEVFIGQGILDLDYYIQKIRETGRDLPVLIEHLHTKEDYWTNMKYIHERYA